MKETIKAEVNRHHEVVELERSSGFVSDYYTIYVNGKDKGTYKDLDAAVRAFEKWT